MERKQQNRHYTDLQGHVWAETPAGNAVCISRDLYLIIAMRRRVLALADELIAAGAGPTTIHLAPGPEEAPTPTRWPSVVRRPTERSRV